jgi:hypothetical protein
MSKSSPYRPSLLFFFALDDCREGRFLLRPPLPTKRKRNIKQINHQAYLGGLVGVLGRGPGRPNGISEWRG